MVYKIEISAKASSQLAKLDNSVRIQIKKFIEKLETRDDPRTLGKALKGNLSGYWRYKVDKYRIVAEIFDDKLVIYVIAVGHRGTIYEKTTKD